LNDDPSTSYYSFDAYWSETEEAALLRDGSGNQATIVFAADGAIEYGSVDDVSGWMFELIADARPEAYLTFAEDCYGVALDLEPIRHVYALMPLTEYVVTSLDPRRQLADLRDGIAEIGYPRS
jgi:hypothetical protein